MLHVTSYYLDASHINVGNVVQCCANKFCLCQGWWRKTSKFMICFTSMANRWPQCAIEIDYVKIRRIANLGDFPPSKNPVKVSVIGSFYATGTLHNWRNILQFKVLWMSKRIIDPTKSISPDNKTLRLKEDKYHKNCKNVTVYWHNTLS